MMYVALLNKATNTIEIISADENGIPHRDAGDIVDTMIRMRGLEPEKYDYMSSTEEFNIATFVVRYSDSESNENNKPLN